MFATVHNLRVFSLLFCALFFLTALPFVARSEEETTATTSATSTESVQPIATMEAAESITPTVSPYQIEGVPGGDSVLGDFVVGPGKADITIAPGETKTFQMTVTNRTGEPRMFNFTVEDATGSTDPSTSIVLLGDDRGPYSMKDYVKLPAMHFELGHNQRARIPVTISIPKDAEPGGRYGSVLVDTVAIKAESGDNMGTVPQSAIVARIGTLFFITIPGETLKEGKMTNFGTVPPKKFYQSSPINFGILHENTGSIHLAPYGEIRIHNMLGEEVGSVELEPWFVLPKSNRLREVTWNREFLFGRYTATANINRSYDDVIDSMSYSFWVLPWKLLLAGFGVVFIVLFLIRAFFRTFEFKRKK